MVISSRMLNRRNVSRLLLATVLATTTTGAAVQAQHTGSQVILTVTGDITTSNRPAFNSFTDAYFKFREKQFSKAFEFTLQDLQALPSRTITAQAENWPGPVQLTGPSLADVLKSAGAQGKPITVTALDGYAIAYTPSEIAAEDWILAWQAGGKPLTIGGRGPLWLIHSSSAKPAPADIEARWIWSAFIIEAGN